MDKLQTNISANEDALSRPADQGAAIQIRKIVKNFETPVGVFTALKGVDLDFDKGEFVGVTGKSGSGKSTLVNMISGIDRPTSGTIQVGGTFTHTLNESEMSRWRGRNLGLVFQFYQLLPMLSLRENVLLPMDFSNLIAPAQREKRALELLAMVGLADQADNLPAGVSGGQQQAAAIARALANDPQFILADEPTGNLDSRMAEVIFGLFEALRVQGKTIIMVTHDPSLAKRTSRQVVIADGEIINEWVLRALPELPHALMLQVTHHLEARQYAPGEVIFHEGAPVDAFHIITRGLVDIVTNRFIQKDQVISQLVAGDSVGEGEILSGAPANATVRSTAHGPVETLSIKRSIFAALISPAQLQKVAVARRVEPLRPQNRTLPRI